PIYGWTLVRRSLKQTFASGITNRAEKKPGRFGRNSEPALLFFLRVGGGQRPAKVPAGCPAFASASLRQAGPAADGFSVARFRPQTKRSFAGLELPAWVRRFPSPC